MSLTDEEKAKIVEEEKLREKARFDIAKKRSMKFVKIYLIAMAVIIVISTFVMMSFWASFR